VGAADLPPYGYITKPGRGTEIDSYTSGINEDQYLRSHDIVLIVKGSVGKVGIVSSDAPGPGSGGWLAGQSAIILRANDNAAVDTRALALLLRSEFGQSLLNRIVSGATIPLIQLRELLELPIVLPLLEEQRRAAEALDREMEIQQEIERLQQMQIC
jgi:type I restriction enzyme M protein